MLSPNPIETELTTGVTDALLGVLCAGLAIALVLLPTNDVWKRNLWLAALVCMAVGAFLGAAAHGLVLSESAKTLIWKPLYLSLGVAVALVAVGAWYDWAGLESARRLLPWAMVVALIFFAATQLLGGSFAIFLVFEGVAIIVALVIYILLAMKGTLPGASVVAVGIALSVVAAVVQASSLTLTLRWQLDHNGLFHLIQMVAIIIMSAGIRASLTGR